MKESSGTNVKSMWDEFQMMISDCEDGNIDLILTKSITKFYQEIRWNASRPSES